MSCKVGLTEPRGLAYNKRNDDTGYYHRNDVFNHASLLNIPWALAEPEVF